MTEDALTRATNSATRVAADVLATGTQPTDQELDQMICEMTTLTAATVATALEVKHHRQAETWVRADWVAARYGVSKRWCYNRAEKLGAISHGRRTLVFPLSAIVAELGTVPEEVRSKGQ